MRQVFYYKMQQFYYKMRQLLQNATFITNCDSTVSNCEASKPIWDKFKAYFHASIFQNLNFIPVF